MQLPRLSPWLSGALLALALAGLTLALSKPRQSPSIAPRDAAPGNQQPNDATCPAGSLEDAGVCVPVPLTVRSAEPPNVAATATQHDAAPPTKP